MTKIVDPSYIHPLPVQTDLANGQVLFIRCRDAIELQQTKKKILNAGLNFFPPINDGSTIYLRPHV